MGSVQPEFFHLMWDKEEKEIAQYEFRFKFINYHSNISVNSKTEKTTIHSHFSYKYYAYVNTYRKVENNMADDFAIIQANIYQITSSLKKKYLGKVEYFSTNYCKLESRYSNSSSGEFIHNESIQYLYYLSGIFFPGCPITINEDPLCYKYTIVNETTDFDTGVLYEREEIITQIPAKVYSTKFGQFTDDVTWKIHGNDIHIYNYTYPNYYMTQDIINTNTEGTSHNTSLIEWVSGDTRSVSFRVYDSSMKDYYLYHDNLYTILDDKINMPACLIKCSDGLDFDTYKTIAQETQYFNKNTAIIFEHD